MSTTEPMRDGETTGTSMPARGRRILLSPFTNTTNAYIDLLKELLVDIGYDVQPLSAKGMLRGGFVDLFRPTTVLVFHWIELRAFTSGGGKVSLSPRGVLVFLFYCLIMAVGRAQVVYFVHDHAVHNARGKVRAFSVRLMSLVRRLADHRVVHAPDFEAKYEARYLPHPLYWDAPGRTSALASRRRAAPSFALLGTIEPYKDVAALLRVWPEEQILEIAGRGDATYVDTLHSIVRERAMSNTVTIDARFLSNGEFEDKVCGADVLILPHAADSMLVSGAFFEAIGRVPVLIARSVPFMVWAAQRFENVFLFDRIEQVPDLVREVAQKWPDLVEGRATRHRVIEAFGWQACRQSYREFFRDVVGARTDR
ncbi:glycosyltransferase [Paraburkholderia phymatum]|uniref:Glycosyltransferase n=1 Tax=Paraburkholderia phymatum TaxID=148447 RepID=A0ACC6U602_9BURK